MAGQPLFDYPLEFRFDDGTVRMLMGNVVPVRDANGEPAGAIAAFMDITPLKLAEQDLTRLVDSLARSNRDLKEFAYVASHDLQEPLRQVSAFVQLLDEHYGGRFEGAAREYMDFIVEGSVRMRNLIHDLLAYTRLDSAGKKLEPIRVQDVVERAMDNLHLSIKENNAKVTWSDLPTVNADRTQMVQVFQNLIGNSIKFRGNEPPEIRIEAQRNEREWLFSITDNGLGFAQQQAEKVFHLFQRLHNRDSLHRHGHRTHHLQEHRRTPRRQDLGLNRSRARGRRFTSRCPRGSEISNLRLQIVPVWDAPRQLWGASPFLGRLPALKVGRPPQLPGSVPDGVFTGFRLGGRRGCRLP